MPKRVASRRFKALERLRAGSLALAILATGVGWPLLIAEPASGEDASVSPPLRIASWDLSEATHLIAPRRPLALKRSWRTTFGSERHTVERAPDTEAATIIDADAVLLQGILDVAAVRRLFPARDWRLVVSRQMLRSDDLADREAEDATPPAAATTAVALRSRPGLRVMGREHLLNLARTEGGAAGTSTAAGTAVRLVDRGRALWLVSVALPDPCSDEGASCPARGLLADWRQGKRAAGERTVIGGRLQKSGRHALPPPPCVHQSIEADVEAPAHQSQNADGAPQPDKGCVAFIELAN